MEKPLTNAEIQRYGARLSKMFEKLSEEIERVERGMLEPSGDPDGQIEDESTEEAAFERDYEALAAEDQLAYQVGAALERISGGSYGTCETCGQPIGRARLDVVPYAAECAPCASRSEAERRR
jgi:RNA polymerase-binding transcription factor DksA